MYKHKKVLKMSKKYETCCGCPVDTSDGVRSNDRGGSREIEPSSLNSGSILQKKRAPVKVPFLLQKKKRETGIEPYYTKSAKLLYLSQSLYLSAV